MFAPLELRAALDALTATLTSRKHIERPKPAPHSPAVLEAYDPSSLLGQKSLWNTVSGALEDGNIILADQGTSFYGMASHHPPAGVTFIGQPLWASIGYTLPATSGAAPAEPDRRTVLLIGDGAAQLTVQEIGTLAQEKLAPVIIVVNNDGYTVERAIHGESAHYNDIVTWDWTAIPAALGVGSDPIVRRVTTVGELRSGLAEAAAYLDRMVVIEAVVPKLDVPPLLTQLADAASAANKL